MRASYICKQLITHLCDGTGQDGAFRPAGQRLQPGFPLRREHGLVRALKRLSHDSLVCCAHACGLSVARPLYLTLKTAKAHRKIPRPHALTVRAKGEQQSVDFTTN